MDKIASTIFVSVTQIHCETKAGVLIARYHARIANKKRHLGHIDHSDDATFLNLIEQGPMDWIDIESERLPVDTNIFDKTSYQTAAKTVMQFMMHT